MQTKIQNKTLKKVFENNPHHAALLQLDTKMT